MYYYKKGSTYMASHTAIPTADEISKEEYDRIKAIIDNRPTAPDGFAYRLTAELEWELYEMPAEEVEEEATAEDYQTALSEMGVEV